MHESFRPSRERAGFRAKADCGWVPKRPEQTDSTNSPLKEQETIWRTCLRSGLMNSTQPFTRWLSVAIVAVATLVTVACDGETPPPSPAGVQAAHTVVPPEPTESPVIPATAEFPEEAPVEEGRQPETATPFPTIVVPTPTPMPLPPLPLPTPHPGNSQWVQHRVNAVTALYRPTAAGQALLHSLDVRQMQGEPGFFGSYGFYGWAGAGEAKPIPLMHELGHSYWGGFPVIGRPDLEWQRPDDGEIPPPLAAYHRDILMFMAQPPDEYELLRQRLRNLPGLSSGNTEPLFHSMEADVPYTTGGDLLLVPPILRKYWAYFLSEGPFDTWERVAGWLQSLSHEERVIASKFLGFDHLDLRLYSGIPSHFPQGDLLRAAAGTLADEERQRLTDLADQFDLLTGDPQLEEDFQFWRGYLRDKVALHRTHPGHLSSISAPRAPEISGALAFLGALEGTPEEQAGILEERIASQPFLVNFLPAVDDRTLVELFIDDPAMPEGPTLQATASFVERLRRFGSLVDEVHAAGRLSPSQGTAALTEYLDATDPEMEQDLKLFFDLFHSRDPELAREITAGLDGERVRVLMRPVPVQMRVVLDPGTLLGKLGITAGAPNELLAQGVELLLEETSGNYRIDGPFLEQLYRVIAERAELNSNETALTIRRQKFPLEGLIQSQPSAASRVLSADIDTALRIVESSDPVVAPPARIIYRLIHSDPILAARLVGGFDRRGDYEIVIESLAYVAYDKSRSERFPALPISLKQDGMFLEQLLGLKGEAWLEEQVKASVQTYRSRAENGEVSPEFPAQYRQTLQAAAALAPASSGVLADVVERAFHSE